MFATALPGRYTRRHVVQGLACLSGAAALSGCAAALKTTSAASAVPLLATGTQPVPSGSIVQASIAVSAVVSGSIAPGFAGFSYEKSMLCKPLFNGANGALIKILQLLGPSVLRIGGNSVDQCTWHPTGAGRTAGQISPSDL